MPHEPVIRHSQMKLHHTSRQLTIPRFGCDSQILVVVQALLEFGRGIQVEHRMMIGMSSFRNARSRGEPE